MGDVDFRCRDLMQIHGTHRSRWRGPLDLDVTCPTVNLDQSKDSPPATLGRFVGRNLDMRSPIDLQMKRCMTIRGPVACTEHLDGPTECLCFSRDSGRTPIAHVRHECECETMCSAIGFWIRHSRRSQKGQTHRVTIE